MGMGIAFSHQIFEKLIDVYTFRKAGFGHFYLKVLIDGVRTDFHTVTIGCVFV